MALLYINNYKYNNFTTTETFLSVVSWYLLLLSNEIIWMFFLSGVPVENRK